MSIYDPKLTIKLLTVENAKKSAALKVLLMTLYTKGILTQQEIDDILAALTEAGNETAMDLGVSPE